MGNIPQGELVLAAATGSTGGLGKITTVPATTGTLLVRCPNTGIGRSTFCGWRVKTDQAGTVQLLRARAIVDAATITLGGNALDDGDGFTLNGCVYTAESTANTANYAARKYDISGNTAAQCGTLAALINADYAVVTAGTSVAATDKLTFVTDEGTKTITAAAAADYPGSKYALSAVVATELASIILAVNHKDNITCASSVTGDKVTIIKDRVQYVFTSAAAESLATRAFDNDSNDNDTATSLAACINDATYGVPGITASASTNVVSLARNSLADKLTSVASSNSTRLAVAKAGGVPGVIAAATGVAGELSITPTWTAVLTVTETGDQLTVTDIDNPGLYAVAGATTVTLSCTTPGSPVGGDKAHTIQFVLAGGAQAADAAEAAFASTTATFLTLHGSATTISASNAAYAGQTVDQWTDGWDELYLLFSNSSGSAANVTVAATKS